CRSYGFFHTLSFNFQPHRDGRNNKQGIRHNRKVEQDIAEPKNENERKAGIVPGIFPLFTVVHDHAVKHGGISHGDELPRFYTYLSHGLGTHPLEQDTYELPDNDVEDDNGNKMEQQIANGRQPRSWMIKIQNRAEPFGVMSCHGVS